MMKFDKRPRYPVPEMSDRAKTLFANKPKRERTKLDKKIPLLADLVEVNNVLTVEQEEDRRRNSFIDWETNQLNVNRKLKNGEKSGLSISNVLESKKRKLTLAGINGVVNALALICFISLSKSMAQHSDAMMSQRKTI